MDTVTQPTSGTRFVHPETVATHFHLREGDKVGDFGAGTGYFTKTLSNLVGNEGRVYALDIQKGLVDTIGQLKIDAQLSNVEPLWCDIEKQGGCKLDDAILDTGLVVNTLFQFENKEAGLKEIARTIRPGGKFFVIDWTESFGGLGPQPGHVIEAENAQKLVEAAGFQYERSFPAGEHHYGLAFRRT